eukprot:409622-Pyramimonas_sp.AAC.1
MSRDAPQSLVRRKGSAQPAPSYTPAGRPTALGFVVRVRGSSTAAAVAAQLCGLPAGSERGGG